MRKKAHIKKPSLSSQERKQRSSALFLSEKARLASSLYFIPILEVIFIVLNERDYAVLYEVYRWRFLISRHIVSICDFSSINTANRRLKKLCDVGYLKKEYILFGLPPLYSITYKGLALLSLPKNLEKIRVDTIHHNITVVDVWIHFLDLHRIKKDGTQTEKQLHSLDGFSNRRHKPDFAFEKDGKTYCVEVELTPKALIRLENNIKDNFKSYDYQIWVTRDKKDKVTRNIDKYKVKYPNIQIYYLSDILEG